MAKDDKIILACEICMSRNYATHRSKKNSRERMELRKYCPKCGRVTLHKETK
jgi:large subunit ribosomal protein L33